MKREKTVTFLVGMASACLLSVGAIGAMVSGLALPVADLGRVYLAICLCALAGCLLFSFKMGWIPALAGTLLALAYLWQYQYLSLPIRALITRLSVIYDSAYAWGVLEFAGVEWQTVSLDLVLGTWGGLTALAAAGTLVGGRSLIPTVLLASAPLVSTVVVLNTVPGEPYLYIWILSMVLLLLTASVRRHSPHQAARLTVLTVLPVALLLGLLFWSNPQAAYDNDPEEQLADIASWFQSHAAGVWDTSGLLRQNGSSGASGTTANLSRVGPRGDWDYPVMEVTASAGGTLYLRGQDYDTYTGTSWTSGGTRSETFTAPRETNDTVTVRTRRPMSVVYLPYYPTLQTLTGGNLENADDLTEYTFQLTAPYEIDGDQVKYVAGAATAPAESAGTVTDLEALYLQYTALPQETAEWAADYVNQIFETIPYTPTYSGIAALIADHVRSSAPYDKNTGRMDREATDFARWFLEDSDTGYCVHFATAAAVLLRAAGVPARYVTGYIVSCEPGQVTTVTADRAHAWVEYYEPTADAWIVLEATPADTAQEEIPATEAPTEPETTPPAATEPPAATKPTVPDGTAAPTEPQAPGTDLRWLGTALVWLLALAGITALVPLQRALRLVRRRGRLRRAAPNTRALLLWQEAERLCRATGQTPPEELEHLAEKAKFSQHTLTAEELHAFDAWLKAEQGKLAQAPGFRRFVYRYVLALW